MTFKWNVPHTVAKIDKLLGKKPKRKRQAHPEFKFQCDVAKYLAAILPKHCFWTFIPGGTIGGADDAAKRGAQVKAMGYRAGTPDFVLQWHGRSIWLELKAKGGDTSKAQDEAHDAIVLSGGVVKVARTLKEIEDFLIVVGIDVRGKIAA